ncbi:hypothetical protein [Actinomadura macra]|uniref:hypothetical protein n=1 Tax=Actinomadura macra TaxID=46164 RepID=UPI0012FB4A87|nr:hypothetical protein [Actinomadura macra]
MTAASAGMPITGVPAAPGAPTAPVRPAPQDPARVVWDGAAAEKLFSQFRE